VEKQDLLLQLRDYVRCHLGGFGIVDDPAFPDDAIWSWRGGGEGVGRPGCKQTPKKCNWLVSYVCLTWTVFASLSCFVLTLAACSWTISTVCTSWSARRCSSSSAKRATPFPTRRFLRKTSGQSRLLSARWCGFSCCDSFSECMDRSSGKISVSGTTNWTCDLSTGGWKKIGWLWKRVPPSEAYRPQSRYQPRELAGRALNEGVEAPRPNRALPANARYLSPLTPPTKTMNDQFTHIELSILCLLRSS